MRPFRLFFVLAAIASILAGCGQAWNDPYPASESGANIQYSAFTNRPKHLDPVQSYSEDEATFTYQIYEPPLQYHYLRRPYSLIPATSEGLPKVTLLGADGRVLPADTDPARVAFSEYLIRIRPGIHYQPHPALATRPDGAARYIPMDPEDLSAVEDLTGFKETASRELEAGDYVHQIKRLASPALHSPVLELMGDYIVGLKALHGRLVADARHGPVDLTQYSLPGAQVVDRYTYRIRLKGVYPQFLYWLAMPFFAPVPPEADRFYGQPGMAEKNLSLDVWPLGTGPYMLTENKPNSRMVLSRNPNFHGERYPCDGEAGDQAAGLLADCGQPLPLIDQVVFTREKESIPYWNKFLQGYYDASGLSSDNFDQAVQMGGQGDVTLTDEMAAKGIRLVTAVSPSIMYTGFNMLDPVVGGNSEGARKLRLALSIAIDQEEFVSVFLNGRGVPAMQPISPGIFGSREGEAGLNRFVYDWHDGRARRKSVEDARRLLAEAGYPNGRDARTGEPLVINLDTTANGLGDKARIDWLTKQLKKINLQLVVRSTDYNRFQDKIRRGNAQLFYWGWGADYPDPENFLFLLYGPQGKVKSQGENAANYANPEYDRLFEQMKAMSDSPARQALIDRMVAILQHDAPWIWGYFEKSYTLQHGWLAPRKPAKIIRSALKYQRLDPLARKRLRARWNQPLWWPALVGGGLMVAMALPALSAWRGRERSTARRSP